MINNYVDNVYILYNTDEEKERVIDYLNNYSIKYTLFKAVHNEKIVKKNVKIDTIIFNKYKKFYKNIKLNENQISHIDSIKGILSDAKDKYNSICILEFDIYFHKNIESILEKCKNIIKNSDIISLGSSQYLWYNNFLDKKTEFKNNYYIANHSPGTFGIILKKQIYDIYFNYLSLYLFSSDIVLNIIGYDFKHIVIYPNIVICNVSKSSILKDRDFKVQCIKYKWNINNYDVR